MTKEEFASWVTSVGGTSKAARILDISPSQVSNYVHGYRNVGASVELKLKKILEQSDTPNVKPASNATIIPNDDVVWLPMYDRPVNAGKGIDIDNATEYRVMVLRSSVPHPDRSIVLKVSGDSMQGCGINEESLLICERVTQGDIDSYIGKIVVAGYDGAVYLKRLVKKGSKYYLHSETVPENKYPDIDLNTFTTWQILAVVVFFKTKL